MAKHEGLLLKIDSKGNISGYMQENDNKIPIENTTIKDELISFSEEDFEEYSELQNEIRKVYRTYSDESEEKFTLIKKLTSKAEKALAEYRTFYGLLNRLMIEDFLGEDDGTENYLREYASYLDQIKTVQFFFCTFSAIYQIKGKLILTKIIITTAYRFPPYFILRTTNPDRCTISVI